MLFWLSRIFSKGGVQCKQLSKKDLSALTCSLIPLMDDSNTEVRDAAAQVFTSLIGLHGESAVIPLISGKLDKIKLAKIGGANAKSPAIAAEVNRPGPTSQAKGATEVVKKKEAVHVEKKPSQQESGQARSQVKIEPVFKYGESDATSYFTSNFPSQYEGLGDANWKTRLEAISSVSFAASVDPEMAVRMMIHRPGWKESNVLVISKAIDVLLKYPRNLNVESVSLLLASGLIEKISETKLQKDIYNLFNKCAEDLNAPHRVFSQLLTLILMVKSPKSVSDAIKYLQNLILDHGQRTIPLQSLASEVSFVKQLLLNPNPLIRSSAVELAASLKGFYGNRAIRDLLSDLPSAILSTLDGEFAKTPHQLEPRKQGAQEIKSTSQMASSTSIGMVVEDSFPRNDETAALSGNLLIKINDSNWKVRKEALDELIPIVNGKKITCAPGVQNELLSGLKNRFVDTNKNIVIQALDASGHLLEALPLTLLDKNYLRGPIVQTACACLSDNKVQVRNAAVLFLQRVSRLVPGMIGVLREELKCESPNAKKEILSLISEILGARGFGSDEGCSPELMSTAIITCLRDRNGEVRKAAQSALHAWTGVVGLEGVEKICQKIAPSLVNSLAGILSKEKAGSAAKPPAKLRLLSKAQSSESVTAPSSLLFITSNEESKRSRLEHDKSLPFGFWLMGEGASMESKLRELTSQFDEGVSPNFSQQLLSSDLKEQSSGLQAIKSFISNSHNSKDANVVINSLDLILKYFAVKLPESSLAFFTKYLDVIEEAFSLLDNANYRLNDAEIGLFLHVFITKSSNEAGGNSRDNLKSRIKSIHRQLCRIYPASRILGILLDLCKNSKSSKIRCECFEEMIALVTRNGSSVLITPNKQLPVIASLVGDKDSACRSLALMLLVHIYEILGEELFYKTIGDALVGKDLDMFQEKLKRKDQLAPSKPSSINSTPAKHTKNVDANSNEQRSQFESEPRVEMDEDAVQTIIPEIVTTTGDESEISRQQGNNNFTFLFRRSGATPFEEHPLDHLIDLIGCTADLQCINAMQKIEESLLKKESAAQTRMEPLVHALAIRLKEACGGELPLDNDPDVLSNKAKLTKFIVNSVLIILGETELAIEMEKFPEVYQLLVEETIRALIGKRVEQELGGEERETVQKSLNLLLVKSLESISPNLAFR